VTLVAARPCRVCGAPLTRTFVDLGMSPPCEDFLTPEQADAGESFYPLHVRLCDQCLLVQLPEYVSAERLFHDDYRYFSSFSSSWLEHARRYTETMTQRLGLGPDSLVVEVASNDGYLLQWFAEAGVRVLGIEPVGPIAAAAEAKGVPTVNAFLDPALADDVVEHHGRADLVVANNVYAHVPDLAGFTTGLATLLAPHGTLTIEVQHLLRLIEGGQYDTIYHEHFQYYTLLTVSRALALGGLVVVDVDELGTHGGSLRVHARHEAAAGTPSAAVARVLAEEAAAGLDTVEGHAGFAATVARVKADLLEFLVHASREGATVAGYGAPGKGNTLLNHCGIRADLLPFTVDLNPHKQGLFLPGSHIPILAPDAIAEARPDYVVVLPWNLRAEISEQLAYVHEWGGHLVFPIPRLDIVEEAVAR